MPDIFRLFLFVRVLTLRQVGWHCGSDLKYDDVVAEVAAILVGAAFVVGLVLEGEGNVGVVKLECHHVVNVFRQHSLATVVVCRILVEVVGEITVC